MNNRYCIPLLTAAALLMTSSGCSLSKNSGSSEKADSYSRTIFAMDTYMTVKIYGGSEKTLDAAESRIKELESELSVTLPDSDISKLNSSGGEPVEVSEDTLAIVKKAVDTGDITGGALDVTAYPIVKEWGFTTGNYTIPSESRLNELLPCVDYRRISIDGNKVALPADQQIDLGALAKGYTGDEVMTILRDNGAEAAVISLGGNVQTSGKKPDGSSWKVAVRDPFSPETDMCVIEVDEKAVITSGNYERCFTGEDGQNYWHIIDPKDGFPADNGIVSATIIGNDGLTCDALSTAMFVKGLDGAAELWRSDRSYDMILVTDDQKIFYTEGIKDVFSNMSHMPAEVITVD